MYLVADSAREQGILSRVRELKAAGYTTRRIANELNQLYIGTAGNHVPEYVNSTQTADLLFEPQFPA